MHLALCGISRCGRDVLTAAVFCTFAFVAPLRVGADESAKERPNVVFIFGDDWGWGDLSCYGNKRMRTPNLDRLARQGIQFTQFYVSASVCSPSRAAIMTGRYPVRDRIFGHIARPELNKKRAMPNFLDPSLPMLTRILQRNGYVTGHFGKWHLGHGPGAPLPDAYGVDDYRTCVSNDPQAKEFDLFSAKLRPVATKLVMNETIRFIEANKDKPFYVNAWLSDMHAPLNPSEEQMKPFARYSPNRWGIHHNGAAQIYYATEAEADKQIGIFLKKLDTLGLAENTIVIFSSDNGPEDIEIRNAAHSGVGSPGPFRGRKRSIYEGGIRMPFIVRWPKGTPAGKVDTTSVIAGVDFLPTICALAGVPLPDDLDIDGQDMSAALRGAPTQRTQPLMWEWRYRVFGHPFNKCPRLAMRDGKWKLLMNPDDSRIELYDIPADPMELNNVADEHADVVARMRKAVLAWYKTLPEAPADPSAGSNAYPWPK
jgi:arylsulfatase A-like enzyme